MENILINGDYVKAGSGVRRAEGDEALLCRALFRLSCRRGSFPFLPELGSRLWKLGCASPAQTEALAMAYAAEAVQPLGLQVTGVRAEQTAEGRLRLRFAMQDGKELEVRV